ncbi:hypothetical protein CSA37_11375 [Candidatus Fermentibacteria bacterium]|nr:MAG: hypothetical protein CSA37_11375 [Candidatus Fermentibacteria bacterium]
MRLLPEKLGLVINSISRGLSREAFTIPMMGVEWDIPEARPLSEEGLLSLEVMRTENEIVVSGSLDADFTVDCARCLDPVAVEVTEEINRIFSWDTEMLTDPEVEPVSHNDGTVSILDPVREAVILSIPSVPLCSPQCRGLCPRCGINRNREDCDHDAEIGSASR